MSQKKNMISLIVCVGLALAASVLITVVVCGRSAAKEAERVSVSVEQSVQSKLDEMKKQYDSEIETMKAENASLQTNNQQRRELSDSEKNDIFREGYTKGYKEGRADGEHFGPTWDIEMAYDSGFDDGYDAGHEDGIAEGNAEGYDEGYDSGYETGYDEGYDEGQEDL